MTTAPLDPKPAGDADDKAPTPHLHLVPPLPDSSSSSSTSSGAVASSSTAPGGSSLADQTRILPPAWERALAGYAEWHRARGTRAATFKTYVFHLRALGRFTGSEDPWALTAGDVDGWLSTLGTQRTHTAQQVRPFYSWGIRNGHTEVQPIPAKDQRPARTAVHDYEAYGLWAGPVERHVTRLVAAGTAKGTVHLHLAYLRRFASSHPDPWKVTEDDVVAWLAHPSWGPSTKRSARGVLRVFYRSMPKDLPSPAADIQTVRVPRNLPRPTPTPVLQEALRLADDKERLMLLLGAYAGLRACEIARVHLGRDLQDDGFLFVRGKGGHERRVPLHPVLRDELEAERARRSVGGSGSGFRWVGEATPDGWLFPSQDAGKPFDPSSVSRALSRVLPGEWTAHSLRHRFGSSIYRARKDIRATQELMGHASPVTTAVYTQVTDDELRAAVMGLEDL